MTKTLIIANWKLNPDSVKRALLLAQRTEQAAAAAKKVEIAIAPPFPFLAVINKVLRKSKLGAQTVSWANKGPYTGEVSGLQLKSMGVKYVILGHSERRSFFAETDELVNKKLLAALNSGLMPVLCVGEKERNGNEIPAIVGEQLKKALAGVKPSRLKNLVVAYEPIWAISTNAGARADSPANAFRASVYLRRLLASLYSRRLAEEVRIIYGGSVNAQNISGFLKEGIKQGALVGGASLNAPEFSQIIKSANLVR